MKGNSLKKLWKIVAATGILSISFLTLSCLYPHGSESVLLQGAVTIGPISPGGQPDEYSEVSPEVFAVRKLMIYDKSGKHLVREVYFTQIDGGATGYYTAQLAPGTYVIDINHEGMDTAENLPQNITVASDETITIDVNIDTGIR